MPRFVLGDAVGLGKTVDCIAAACYIKDRYPGVKVIVLTTKSTVFQWEDEFQRFSTLRPYVMRDTFAGKKSYEARYAQLETFFHSDKTDVMICKYSSMVGKRKTVATGWDEQGKAVEGKQERVSQEIKRFCQILKPHGEKVILILDEGHKFMHYNQTRKLVLNLAKCATAVWTLTATSIKNRLDEFYCISSAIGIRPFGYADDFKDKFCLTYDIPIRGGFTKEIITGYKNIPEFKTALRPFFIGRSQKQVKEPLPILTTAYHPIDLDEEQSDILLNQIPSGELPLPPRLVKAAGEFYEKERDPENKMTMLSVYQLVANHPCLLDPENLEAFYSKKLSPKEEALLDMLDGDFAGEKVIVYAQPLDAKISTPLGWKKMRHIAVGDLVSDPDGGTAFVEDIYPQGKKAIYRITTESGASTECSEDHLWTVQTYTDRYKHTGRWRTYPLKKIFQKPLLRTNKDGSKQYRYFLPISSPVEFISQRLPLPPYTLGVLLGDGDITRSATFCSADAGIVQRIRKEASSSIEVVKYAGINYGLSTKLTHQKDAHGHNLPGANAYVNTLKKLALLGSECYDKFIPEAYLRSSVPERYALLRGLMDTDGTIGDNNQPHFSSTSKKLAEGVAELVRSLGGIASVLGPYPSFYTRNGVKLEGALHWQVNIRTLKNPFYLKRKAKKWGFVEVGNPIKSIEFVGHKECQCIRVSSKRSLYLTDDYIPSHNTKYRSWINRLERITKDKHFTDRKFLRITGAESEKRREANKRLFQDPNSGYDLIVINAAGMEGINLQSAAHLIALDVPWSWGDLIQLVGRMVRMASPHTMCTLHVMVAKGTIDEYAIETLKGKKGIFEAILGQTHSAGILDDTSIFDLSSGMDAFGTDEDFHAMLRVHAKKYTMTKFITGEQLAKVIGDEEYQMTFERKPREKKKDRHEELFEKWGGDTVL